jgi:RimJ/RimL family protein N-acetyltransferase
MELDFEFIDGEVFMNIYNENRPKLFSDNITYNVSKLLDSTEIENFRKNSLNEFLKHYFLIARYKDEIIGWSYGRQENSLEFTMINSAVFPAYRNQGVYTQMLQQVKEKIVSMGFSRIVSKHHTTNNAILIAKLKFGFIITGIEIEAHFGQLLTLKYFTNKALQSVYEDRTGFKKMEDHIKEKLI